MFKIYRRYRPEPQISHEAASPSGPHPSHSDFQRRNTEISSFRSGTPGMNNAEHTQCGTNNSISSKKISSAKAASQSGVVCEKKVLSPSSNHGSAHSGQSSHANSDHHKSIICEQSKQNSNQRYSVNTTPKVTQSEADKKARFRAPDLASFVHSLIPSSVYNPKTRKILGAITAEDLLIIALIFLFLENDENNDPLMVVALIYILISDYIDLPDWNF